MKLLLKHTHTTKKPHYNIIFFQIFIYFISDNGFTLDMVKNFTEQDIQDIAKDCLKDRFKTDLLSDAAKGANLWKKAPRLSEISVGKREAFLNLISWGAPQLTVGNIK